MRPESGEDFANADLQSNVLLQAAGDPEDTTEATDVLTHDDDCRLRNSQAM
jgi:hypothetical protein